MDRESMDRASMDQPPRGRASRLSADRREVIFARTVELVVERGYAATTVEEIAAATGSSKATLYRHWKDKPTLVVTALSATSEIDLAAIDTGSFIGDMERLMDMLALRAPRNVALVLTLAEASRHDPSLREALAGAALPELATLDAILANAAGRGEITPTGPTRHVADLIVGALFGSVLFGGSTDHLDSAYLRGYLHQVIAPLLLASRNG